MLDRQARSFLQGPFVSRAFIEAGAIKWCMDIAVGRRIQFLVIDAIEDTKEVVTPGTQQRVKSLAKGGRQYFLGIAFADGGDGVGRLPRKI